MPAPWATVADVCAPCGGDYSIDEAALEDWLQVASDVLYELTGRQWPGETVEVMRPCHAGAGGDPDWRMSERVRGHGWCGCTDPVSCGCHRTSALHLWGYPAVEVTEVLLDGAVLDPSRYRLDRQDLLYLPQDGDRRRTWPCCQRIDLPTTEQDTWEVTYVWGTAPPLGGTMAAAALGCQLYLACHPAEGVVCRLPSTVIAVARQGVTTSFERRSELTSKGYVGLAEVDTWLGSVYAGRSRRRATVMLPTQMRHRSRT